MGVCVDFQKQVQLLGKKGSVVLRLEPEERE
jgi:hypothetical protein